MHSCPISAGTDQKLRADRLLRGHIILYCYRYNISGVLLEERQQFAPEIPWGRAPGMKQTRAQRVRPRRQDSH